MIRQHISARQLGIALGAVVCAGIGLYAVWYNSAGKFPDFPSVPNEYVDLGQAFLRGQVSLLEQPDPRFIALSNPYDYQQRKDLPYHFDVSYFHGKYYLYWGPVPAVVAAVLQAITGNPPPAPLLELVGYLGLLAVFFGILIRLSSYFSGRAPSLSLGLFVLLGLMNLPLLYVLGNPRVYEAAILYGQFFLMAGLLAWLNYVYSQSRYRSVWLSAAGLSWGLAIASRYNLGLAVVIYLAFLLVWLWREAGLKEASKKAAWLLGPLLLCAVGIGIYDFVRFQNPIEVGASYILGVPVMGIRNYSISYIPSSLYMYLRFPLSTTDTFPFLQASHFRSAPLPAWLEIPETRNFGRVVYGLLPSVPAVWLSVLAIQPIISAIRSARRHLALTGSQGIRIFHFAMISVAAGAQFLFLLVYFDGAERYLVDFFPSLILLLALLVWNMDEKLRSMRPLRLLLWLSTIGLTLWTAGIGFFACFGVDIAISRQFDPALLAGLAAFWNGLYGALHFLSPMAR